MNEKKKMKQLFHLSSDKNKQTILYKKEIYLIDKL